MTTPRPVVAGTSCALIAVGLISLLVAFLAALGTAQAFIERSKYGRGIMFADAEFLAVIAVLFGLVGALALFVGARLRKPSPHTPGPA